MTQKKKPTIKDLEREIVLLERITTALNTAVVGLAYAVGIKGNELDDVKAEDYAKYVTEHVHPLVKKADELVLERAKQIAEEVNKEKKDDKK